MKDVLFVCTISEVTTDAKGFSEKKSADHDLDEGSILCLTFLCMYTDREAVRGAMLLKQEGMHILLGFCSSEGRPELWNACDVQFLVCIRVPGCLEHSLII